MKKLKTICTGLGMLSAILSPAIQNPVLTTGGETTIKQQSKKKSLETRRNEQIQTAKTV